MGLRSVLVDRARLVVKEGTGVKVEGTTLMEPGHGEWFRCRLFLDMQQYEERSEQGGRRKRVKTPQVMFGVKDVAGDPLDVRADSELEVDSKEFGRALWQITGDPQPIRKKRRVIGGLVQVERVVETPREGVV
ncbi:MAG: hypothetical protein ABW167_20620 [Baekduia sp.]